jgi:hypothetical protein
MLCVYKTIKGPTELVTIIKPDEILSLSDVSAVHCSLITTASGGANVQHSRYTYDAAWIKSISPPNFLVTRHRLNDHQRQIMVQGDGDHDLCTGGSYAEAMVVLTSTQTSRLSKGQRTRTADSRVEVQGDGAGDHYTGG